MSLKFTYYELINCIKKVFKNYWKLFTIFFAIVILLLISVLNHFSVSEDNLRYFLSANAQSFAAILAVTITSYVFRANIHDIFKNILEDSYLYIEKIYLKKEYLIKLTSASFVLISINLFFLAFVSSNFFINYIITFIIILYSSLLTYFLFKFFLYMISVEGMQGFLTAIEKHIDSLHASQLEYFIELFENKQELIDSEIKDISAKKRLNKILSINIMKRFNQNLHNYNINQGYDLFPTEFLNKYKEVSMRKKDFDRREDNVIYDFEEGIWNYAQICSKDSHMQKYSTVYYNSLLVLIKKLYSSERNNILKRIFDKRRSLKKLKKINLNTFHSIKTKVTEIGVFIITYVNYDFDLFLIFLKNMTFLHKDELEILQKIQSEIHKRDEYLLEEFKETNNKIGDSKLTRREFLEQKFKEEDYYGIVAEKNEMCYIELDKRISELNKFLSN